MLQKCGDIWDQIRLQRPLIHCISNYVTLNDVANIIIASGASPAMCEHPAEAGDFSLLAGALYLNLGTLTSEQLDAMLAMVIRVKERAVPVVVDPVACGVIMRKGGLFQQMANEGRISLVKGNHAEIMSLAGAESRACGVDSLETGEGLEEVYRAWSVQNRMVVAATGSTDIVTDGLRSARLHNGSGLCAQITGSGCMAGSVVAACAAVECQDQFLAAVTGLSAFNIAAEQAEALSGPRPGSFRMHLQDCLFSLRGADIIQGSKIQCLD